MPKQTSLSPSFLELNSPFTASPPSLPLFVHQVLIQKDFFLSSSSSSSSDSFYLWFGSTSHKSLDTDIVDSPPSPLVETGLFRWFVLPF